MKRMFVFVTLASVMSFPLATPVSAHHSFAAAFDMDNSVTVQGVLTQVRLENPHSWFFVEVKDASGKTETWSFEAGTPSGMIRNGFRKDLIKIGTLVTIKGPRAKDHSKTMGMLRELIMPDGKVFSTFGSEVAK